MVAGVSGGLARYFEIHPAVFRVGVVVLTLLGGAGILIYAAAALVIPDEGKEDSVATAALRNRRDRPWPLIGLGFLAIAGAILLSRVSLSLSGGSWFLFLLAGLVILWITRQPAVDPSAPAAAPADLARRDSRRMRRLGTWLAITLATLVALVLIAVAAFFAVFDVHTSRGVGDRTTTVTSIQALDSPYRLGMGSLKLDLGSLQLPPGKTRVVASVDVGELRVIVPAGVALTVHGTARVGQVDLPGTSNDSDGHNAESTVIQTGARVLVLDAHAGVGSVQVERAVR